MILKLQKIRAGTKYESYRVSLPKSLIEFHNLQDALFLIEFKRGKLVLNPLNKSGQKSK